MKQRIFITTLSSNDSIGHLNLSFAACNFSRNLMSGGMFDKIYSIFPPFVTGDIPLSYYPQDAELVYSCFRKKNNIFCKLLSLLDENIKIFRQIPKGASVWYYNLCMLNVVLFICLKIFKPSVKQNVIVLDFTPSSNPFSLLNFYKFLFNRAHSNILLSPCVEFKNSNSVCLPGVVPNLIDAFPRIEKKNNHFLVSGALNENISMLKSLLIPAFKVNSDLILHISGEIKDEPDLLAEIKLLPNIIYHGKLSFNEYMDLLHSVTFVLSTRNPLAKENLCNFPSKIIESLLHNRAVISTINYKQLKGINYFIVSKDVSNFVLDLQKIVQMRESDISKYFNQSDITKQKFSPFVWKNVIIKLENNEK